MTVKSIATVVEAYFSAKYLFAPENAVVRQGISPSDGEGVPPLYLISNLIGHRDVLEACAAESVPTDDEAAMVAAIAAALQNSSVVEVVTTPKGKLCLRRRAFLTEAENPQSRSVVIRPIHHDADMGSIRSYMDRFGPVEDVFQRPSVRDGAVVVFATAESAERCADAEHSYGKLPVAFGQHFVPRLTVTMLESYYEQRAYDAKAALDRQIQRNIVAAQRELASKAAEPAVRSSLTSGRVIQVVGISDTVTWQEIKAKLGNLACNEPRLKWTITNVRIVEEGEGREATEPRTAFVVMKSTDAAKLLLETYATLSGEFMHGVKAVCPGIQLPDAATDKWVEKQFPLWNAKRPRQD